MIRICAFAIAVMIGLWSGSSRAELQELRVARQYGLTYLQFMVMERHRLIEKHAGAAQLKDIKVDWSAMSDGAAINDALISGTIHFAAGGIGAFVTLWERTRGRLDVKSPGALNAMPMLLISRSPDVTSIKDLSDRDRLAIPGVKVSPQAVTLQYAASQAFGFENYDRLDRLTVNLAHPSAMQALLAGKTEITGHFATPPFSYQELRQRGMRVILNSYDVWGGPQTLIVAWTTSKFQKENPKLFAATVAAMEEATAWINANRAAAAELYRDVAQDKDSFENILAILNDPQIEFSTIPKNIMKFVEFKHRIGTMKIRPENWKDLFFANVHSLPGS